MSVIEIRLPEGTAEAWVSVPADRADDAPLPGVLLFIDAIGLRPQIHRVAHRIASWGYVVLAPNLFYRTGTATELAPSRDLTGPGAREEFFATVGPRMRDLTAERAFADMGGYLAALRALPGVSAGPIGVTGYCMGARLAVRMACRFADDVAACGGFHGGNLVTESEDSPHLGLPNARAAFAFGHAENDGSMPPEAVAALEQALRDAGLEHTNAVYPGASHGYVMADTSMYDERGAERHFSELRELLDRTLSAAPNR